MDDQPMLNISDLEMDILFQPKKRDLSVGKRFRISEEEVIEEKEVVSEPYPIPFKLPSEETLRKIFNSSGDRMMEVFRVIVNREGHISGKIFIDIAVEMRDIYKAEEEQYVTRGGDLLLTGAVLPTDDCVLIFADLNHKTNICRSTRFNKGSYSRRLTNCDCFYEEGRYDESKYRGFYWHAVDPKKERLLNTPLSHKFTSGKLTATLFFALFRNAIQANVEVRLINESSEKIGVYGLIEARNSMFEDPRYKCILFSKNFTERLPLVPEDPIQLSRSVLAVPVKFNLIVRVDLRSMDTDIPRGELIFPVPVELSGTTEELLGDKVQVRVTWKIHWYEYMFL